MLSQFASAGTASNQPTQYEQYMLQIINRARANGGAEMDRLGPETSVNEGPPTINGFAWTIYNTVPPLAWNTQLTAAAQSHANNLQSADWRHNRVTYGGPHTVNGNFPAGASDPDSRIYASGYPLTWSGVRTTTGGWRTGPENVAWGWGGNNGWSDAEMLAAFNGAHKGLFEDYTASGRGHRITTMLEHFREIGLGTSFGSDNNGGPEDTYYMVQNFGRSSSQTNPFLTGLAYNDVVVDNFFTPALTPTSESITGLTVQARQSGNTVASVAAFDTGGYSLPLPAGTYSIFFVKADGTEHSAGSVVMASDNKELNVKTPTFVATFASWMNGFPGAAAQPGFAQDADGDGVPNGVEHILGTSPADKTTGLYQISKPSAALKFRHSRSNSIIAGITHSYQWSTDLVNWHSSGQTNASSITATITSSTIVDNSHPLLDTIEVSATITAGTNKKIFVRLAAAK
jgi:Cysteine-rich secretory protein family